MEVYTLLELEKAQKSLDSTLKKIEKVIISLEEKQNVGGNYQSQITLSKNRVKALVISLDLIAREMNTLNKKDN